VRADTGHHQLIGGAAVVLSNAVTGLNLRVLADSAGFYRVAGLSPAVYSVTATASQFERCTADNVTVPVDEHVRLDLTLAVAGHRTSVTIRSGANLLPAEGQSRHRYRPSLDRRPAPQPPRCPATRASPAGVAPPVQDSELSTRGRFSMHARVGREEFNDYLLDGAENNDQYENTYTYSHQWTSSRNSRWSSQPSLRSTGAMRAVRST
jgi:hypothetical protein